MIEGYNGLKKGPPALRVLTADDMGCGGRNGYNCTFTGWTLREVVRRERIEEVKIKEGGHNNQTGVWEPDQIEHVKLDEPLFVLEQAYDDTIARLEADSKTQCDTINKQRDECAALKEQDEKLQQKLDFVTKQGKQQEQDRKRAEGKQRDLLTQLHKMESDMGTLRKQMGEQEWNKLLGKKS